MARYIPRLRDSNPDPTPDEIRERTESIRSRWSDHEQERRSGFKTQHWMPPLLGSNEVPGLTVDFDMNPAS